MSASVHHFPFDFDPRYRLPARLVGVHPRSARVSVGSGRVEARFGPWRVVTPLTNVADASLSGPFGYLRTVGPAHLSFADRGLTMATNGRRGVCLSFAEPVRGIEPTGVLRHPGLTVTVADCAGLLALLSEQRR